MLMFINLKCIKISQLERNMPTNSFNIDIF